MSHTGITRIWIECGQKRWAQAVKPRLQIVDPSIYGDPHRVGIGSRSLFQEPLGEDVSSAAKRSGLILLAFLAGLSPCAKPGSPLTATGPQKRGQQELLLALADIV